MEETHVEMIRHMLWADEQIWSAIAGNVAAAEDEPLRKLFYHLHVVQNAFLQLWRDEEVNVPKSDSFDGLEAIAAWSREVASQIRDFVETARGEILRRELPVAWAARADKLLGRAVSPVTLRQSIVQVAMHSAYHRGQINARLRALGVEPPLVDFIAWVWLGQPAPSLPTIA